MKRGSGGLPEAVNVINRFRRADAPGTVPEVRDFPQQIPAYKAGNPLCDLFLDFLPVSTGYLFVPDQSVNQRFI